jgi:opacity protein-like surface antigen
MFVLEASVGYQKGDLGDVEVQAQFTNQVIPINQDFDFRIFRLNAGTITEVPIQLTAIARFRPKASFNPYIGAGLGYTLVGYEPSEDMNALSANIDSSRGGFSALSGSGFTGLNLGDPQDIQDLSGATVSARDTFEWHAVGGVEYSFHSKWAAFLDFRYIFASREVNLGFNGAQSVGISVPNTAAMLDDPVATAVYGAVGVTEGGFVDGGHLEPPSGQSADVCIANPGICTWVETPDGQVDEGKYYVKGGKIRYGGASIQIGIRYTF